MSVYTHSVQDLIRTRASWRRFQVKPLAEELQSRLHDYLFALPTLPFPGQTRFQIVTTFKDNPGAARALGTYGNIVGATYFLAGAVTRAPFDLENYAYQFEHIILLATDLELGTCWLGGSFNRGHFADGIHLRPEEYIPAVSPIGYITSERSFSDRLLRWQVQSAQRKPWADLFFDGAWDVPLAESGAGAYAAVLEMVRLAPSASNRQPWRIVKEPGKPVFHLYLLRNALYTQVAKTLMRADDIQRLDMGIAMCHFELAARELKLAGQWQRLAETPVASKADYLVTWNGER